MSNFPLFPEQASSIALSVDMLYLFEVAVSVFFSALIFGLVVYFAYHYHEGAVVDRSRPIAQGLLMESIWMGIPFVFGMIMFTWGAALFYRDYEAPPDALEIDVVGKQWMWYIQHQQGRAEINELHVPLGKPVKLKMISQDVIHSFYLPSFRVKQDVLPGRYTSLWFEATKIGRYHLFCAEYCGTNHSVMGGSVEVMEPADYERWLAEGGTGPSMAQEGEKLFVEHHCAGCHRGSQAVKAPRLEGVFGKSVPVVAEGKDVKDVKFITADVMYIRDSILRPKSQVVAGFEPLMPSFDGQISEPDLLRIIAYIKSIADEEVPQ